MPEREKSSCPSCGYPNRAGHSSDCQAGQGQTKEGGLVAADSKTPVGQEQTHRDVEMHKSPDGVYIGDTPQYLPEVLSTARSLIPEHLRKKIVDLPPRLKEIERARGVAALQKRGSADEWRARAEKEADRAKRLHLKEEELREKLDHPVYVLLHPNLLEKLRDTRFSAVGADIYADQLIEFADICEEGEGQEGQKNDTSRTYRDVAEYYQQIAEKIQRLAEDPILFLQKRRLLKEVERCNNKVRWHNEEASNEELREKIRFDLRKTDIEFVWLTSGWKDGKDWEWFKKLDQAMEDIGELERKISISPDSGEMRKQANELNDMGWLLHHFRKDILYLGRLGEEIREHHKNGTVDDYIESLYNDARHNQYVGSWFDIIRMAELWREMHAGGEDVTDEETRQQRQVE